MDMELAIEVFLVMVLVNVAWALIKPTTVLIV
jgi:hypothetical protein